MSIIKEGNTTTNTLTRTTQRWFMLESSNPDLTSGEYRIVNTPTMTQVFGPDGRQLSSDKKLSAFRKTWFAYVSSVANTF